VPFSIHALTRDIRQSQSVCRSPERTIRRPCSRPKSPSEDRALERRRVDQNESNLLCDANPPARNRPPLDRSLAVPMRRNAPVDGRDSRRLPEGIRLENISRPKPEDATCLCSALPQAAELHVGRSDQPERTHICVFAYTSSTRRLSSARGARTRTRYRQARTSRPKTPS